LIALLAAADAALLELGDERLDERRRQPAVGGVERDGMRARDRASARS
jgi:hypothetical protein